MAGSSGIRITITNTQGSTPRENGAVMWVGEDQILGSIGGGALEHDAILKARDMMQNGQSSASTKTALGPEIGQCCGGQVELAFEVSDPPHPNIEPIAIFGAGHVGAKLASLARSIPYAVSLYDPRASIPLDEPAPYEHIERPEIKIPTLATGSHVLILTHDHALDFRLAEAALLRDDLGFIGMIGSQSKAARFRSQFRALGTRLDRLHSPIAKSSSDKRPAAIALAILAELMETSNPARG